MEKCDILAATPYIYIKFTTMFDKQAHKEAWNFVFANSVWGSK